MVGINFVVNDLELVEAEANDDIGFTQADEMDNAIENGVKDNDLFVGNARKCHNSSIFGLSSYAKKLKQYESDSNWCG